MNCVICRHGETHSDTATITLERDGLTLVVKSVPAQVCDNCGEEYLDESITEELLQQAAHSAETGVRVEIREYAGV